MGLQILQLFCAFCVCLAGTVIHTASVFILVFCPWFVFVLWSFVLSFVYPSLEISVTL